MKTKFNSIFVKFLFPSFCLMFFSAFASSFAKTYIINFGGALGESYSPSSLNISVGDIIQWQGDFSAHPLSSTSIPAGAQSFRQSAGSVFSYNVTITGSYLYQCDFHAGNGMTGSFTVTAATNIQTDPYLNIPEFFKLEQNYPNPFNPSTKIKYTLPANEFVAIKVYDILGREVTILVNEQKTAGNYETTFDAKELASGIYLYKIVAGEFVQTKKMILMK
jgi:plastocyanin